LGAFDLKNPNSFSFEFFFENLFFLGLFITQHKQHSKSVRSTAANSRNPLMVVHSGYDTWIIQ
jgi:hypothetical protein